MKTFTDKLAVVTGGGTGMGRALTRQLAAAGCDVAICDVAADSMAHIVNTSSVNGFWASLGPRIAPYRLQHRQVRGPRRRRSRSASRRR